MQSKISVLLFRGEGKEETGDGEMDKRSEHNDVSLHHPAFGPEIPS